MKKKIFWWSSCLLILGAFNACGDDGGGKGDVDDTKDPASADDAGGGGSGNGGASAGSNNGANGPSNNGGNTFDAGTTDAAVASDAGVIETTNFRVSSLVLSSPSIYALNGAVNATFAVNAVVKAGVAGDIFPFGSPDGVMDISLFLRFPPELGESGDASFGGAYCLAPLDERPCIPDPNSPFFDVAYTHVTDGTCLTSGTRSIEAPCYLSSKRDLSVTLGALGAMPLKSVEMAAQFSGDETKVDNALIRGFLTKANADLMKVPESLPQALTVLGVVPGAPLTSVLREQDQDTLDGEVGWWFTATASGEQHAFKDIDITQQLP